MNKRKIILGILIVMAMAICGAFVTKTQPTVFASEMTVQQSEGIVTEAGTFYGQGYYEVGQTATLKADMNVGYAFDAWVAIDESNVETVLSTEEEYAFVVDGDITIEYRYHKIQYDVTFANDLWTDVGKTELKDFSYSIENNTQSDGNNYYNNEIEITLNIKNGTYIYNLLEENIIINGVSLDNIKSNNPMNVGATITNMDITGLSSVVITLNIQQDVEIDINYTYMYQLSIVSADEGIDVSELMQFITVSNHAGLLDEDNYIYLVRADKQVTITTLPGDDVYTFVTSQFQGNDPTTIASNSYMLYGNSIFTVTYVKVNYIIDFNTYLINLHGAKDLITILYNIADVGITAGDTIGFVYDDSTKAITITDRFGAEHIYEYPVDVFGYKFVGFAINNEILASSTYTLSSTKPKDVEIQLIFEPIEYDYEIKLVDEYFADDITYSVSYDNKYNKLVTGTNVVLQATTTKYVINGWSCSNNPNENGYIDTAEIGAKSDNYTFTFEPTSDDNSQPYTIYLDVDYSYLSVEYNLKSTSIMKHMEYDVVAVDSVNKTITFSDSEGKVATQVVNYTDSDITVNSGVTIISTAEFGNIEIEGDELSYTINLIKQTSVSKVSYEGVDTYTFNKYTYFGELQVGVVEDILLSENGENITISLNGTTYAHDTNSSGALQTFTTTKTYDNSKGAYLIDYHYSMYLYEGDSGYEYITLRDVKYYYDGSKFVLNNAIINKPEDVDCVVTKGSTYSIKLNNLLPNSVLIYSTKSINDINYSFTTYTNQSGSSLWYFDYNGYNTCILNSTTTSQVNADYRQLANNITLLINNENAYQYDNIAFTVQGNDGIINGAGNTISAKDNEIITITIMQDNIAKGYKFDSYIFGGTNLTDDVNPLILVITMDSNTYANGIININFSAIEYTININYINSENTIINQDEANGGLRLQGQLSWISLLAVDVVGDYTLEAVANIGYYVSKAYIGTEAYSLNGLLGNNSSEDIVTVWQLNSINFEQAIIDNAGEGTEVNLYIQFEIHTYGIRVYFEIEANANAIVYPNTNINGVVQTLTVSAENESGIEVTKRYVEAKGFKYNSNIVLQLDNFMLGTTISQWKNSKGEQLAVIPIYILSNIKQDTVLYVELQYIPYVMEFVSLDENGETCNYGVATSTNKTFKLFETVNYTINIEQGYVLKQKYYKDSTNNIGTENIESGFTFNPANFKIRNGTTVILYFVFGLKSVNLNMSNTIEGNMYYFEGQNAEDLANYTVKRQRENVIETLTAETGYQFQTGDILTMEISIISIGIELNKVQLGDTSITLSSAYPYSLRIVENKDEDELIDIYYILEVEFTPSVINGLSDEASLQNILKVKTFKINYTYNYIDYKFGIRLTRRYDGGSSATGNEDTAMVVNNLGFGTSITFGCTYEGINTGDGAKFTIDGYSIAGIKQSSTDRFTFEDIKLWEQVALNKYSENSNEIEVVLVLRPKITLNNYTTYTQADGYVYERTYNGENQGLVILGARIDVVIGGDFEAIVQYSFDNGLNFVDEKPINVGSYQVKIIAKIISDNSQVTNVIFEEKVVYVVTPAQLAISLKTYNLNNPITKTYDGTNNLSSKIIADDIGFNGLFDRDKDNVYVDATRLRAQFEDVLVNTASNLYDITVLDIYLIDASNNLITNYTIASGQNVIFTNIGKINPKALTITGFIAKNKVYDGTNAVTADISGISYIGKLATDSTQVLDENLKFYLKDYTIGEDREVFIDWTNALVGADSTNYSITFDRTFIDVHPYEITYDLKDYGTFKVVDVDRLGLIPIGSRILARAFDKGTDDYRTIYTTIEPQIAQGEKLKSCLEIIMQVNSINIQLPEGLYVYIPKINKITKVIQVPEEKVSETLEYSQQTEYTIIKVAQGEALIGVIVHTTYLPLWAIILIVIGGIILVGILVIIFIIIRRRTKRKYSVYDRI